MDSINTLMPWEWYPIVLYGRWVKMVPAQINYLKRQDGREFYYFLVTKANGMNRLALCLMSVHSLKVAPGSPGSACCPLCCWQPPSSAGDGNRTPGPLLAWGREACITFLHCIFWFYKQSQCLRLKGTSGSIWLNPCSSKDTQSRIARIVSRRLLELTKEEAPQSLENLCKCSVTWEHKSAPGVWMKPLEFQFVPTVFCSSTGHHWNEPGCVLFSPSLQILVGTDEILWSSDETTAMVFAMQDSNQWHPYHCGAGKQFESLGFFFLASVFLLFTVSNGEQ